MTDGRFGIESWVNYLIQCLCITKTHKIVDILQIQIWIMLEINKNIICNDRISVLLFIQFYHANGFCLNLVKSKNRVI